MRRVSAYLGRGWVRAAGLLIGLHGVSLLLHGAGAWRGFWFGLGHQPAWMEAACELGLAAALWRRGPSARWWVAAMAAGALGDAVGYYLRVADGRLGTSLPVPMSLLLGVGLAAWAARPPVPRRIWTEAPAVALGLAAMPALWILAFGLSDYRRPADAAVVLGARAHPDLTPSLALRDRTVTGLDLYRNGTVRTLVFSGGPGEAETMSRMAAKAGVPPEAQILDPAGLNTRETARHLAALARRHGWRRVLAVSHWFHLPRVKMACVQEGIEVRTVPCAESRPLASEPIYFLRECAGFYAYLVGWK